MGSWCAKAYTQMFWFTFLWDRASRPPSIATMLIPEINFYPKSWLEQYLVYLPTLPNLDPKSVMAHIRKTQISNYFLKTVIGRSLSKLIVSYRAQVLRQQKIKNLPSNSFKALGKELALFIFLFFFFNKNIISRRAKRICHARLLYPGGFLHLCF